MSGNRFVKSVPNPMMEPLRAIRAPSPPVLPPGVKAVLKGIVVVPKTLLIVSAV